MIEQTSGLLFRKATQADIPFLVDTIVAAEKSGSEIFSYSTIFEMPEQEIRELLAAILAEDAPGQELCVSDYLIAQVNGQDAGALAGWIEGESGQPSGLIKGTLLKYFFPRKNLDKAASKKNILDEVHFERESGVLAMESGFTLPDFRGKKVLASLMLEFCHRFKMSRPELKKAQMYMVKSNELAFNIYRKIGFEIVEEKISNHPDISRLIPSPSKILIEKQLY